jgi:hypothetical protein
MTPPSDPRRRWLDAALPPERTGRLARDILARARQSRLNLRFLGFESWETSPDRETLVETLRNELIAFLLENPGLLDHLRLAPESQGANLLRKAFLNHWRDATRKHNVDPRKSLRKFVQDAIRDSERFAYRSEGAGGPRFALAADAVPAPPFTDDDRADIPYPADAGRMVGQIRKAAVVQSLAEHFLRHAAGLFEVPRLSVQLDDFVQWLEDHLEFPVPQSDEFDETRHRSAGDGSFAPRPSPERIAEWVETLAAGLADAEARLLVWHFDEELPLKAIAERLGRKGPSGARYALKKAEARVVDFWKTLPPEADEATFRIFLHQLLSRLKNPEPKP